MNKTLRKKRKNRSIAGKLLRAIFFTVLVTVTFLISFRVSAKPTIAENNDIQTYKYYTCVEVECGDSLWSIAKEHMTVEYASIYDYMEEVMQINNLKSDDLISGMKLCIPYYCAEEKI